MMTSKGRGPQRARLSSAPRPPTSSSPSSLRTGLRTPRRRTARGGPLPTPPRALGMIPILIKWVLVDVSVRAPDFWQCGVMNILILWYNGMIFMSWSCVSVLRCHLSPFTLATVQTRAVAWGLCTLTFVATLTGNGYMNRRDTRPTFVQETAPTFGVLTITTTWWDLLRVHFTIWCTFDVNVSESKICFIHWWTMGQNYRKIPVCIFCGVLFVCVVTLLLTHARLHADPAAVQ